MATSFPVGIDTLSNPTSENNLSSPSHSTQHINANDAIEALEAKVGVDSSAVASSHDYKISALETSVAAILNTVYPVGTVYTNYEVATNPGTLLGIGTWVAIEGEVVVGYKSGDADFGTPSGAVGEKTHTLSEAELASHDHSVNPPATNTDNDTHTHTTTTSNIWGHISGTGTDYSHDAAADVYNFDSIETIALNNDTHNHSVNIAAFDSDTAGSGTAHNNIQPSRVCYVWRRTE